MPAPTFRLATLPLLVWAIWPYEVSAVEARPVLLPGDIPAGLDMPRPPRQVLYAGEHGADGPVPRVPPVAVKAGTAAPLLVPAPAASQAISARHEEAQDEAGAPAAPLPMTQPATQLASPPPAMPNQGAPLAAAQPRAFVPVARPVRNFSQHGAMVVSPTAARATFVSRAAAGPGGLHPALTQVQGRPIVPYLPMLPAQPWLMLPMPARGRTAYSQPYLPFLPSGLPGPLHPVAMSLALSAMPRPGGAEPGIERGAKAGESPRAPARLVPAASPWVGMLPISRPWPLSVFAMQPIPSTRISVVGVMPVRMPWGVALLPLGPAFPPFPATAWGRSEGHSGHAVAAVSPGLPQFPVGMEATQRIPVEPTPSSVTGPGVANLAPGAPAVRTGESPDALAMPVDEPAPESDEAGAPAQPIFEPVPAKSVPDFPVAREAARPAPQAAASAAPAPGRVPPPAAWWIPSAPVLQATLPGSTPPDAYAPVAPPSMPLSHSYAAAPAMPVADMPASSREAERMMRARGLWWLPPMPAQAMPPMPAQVPPPTVAPSRIDVAKPGAAPATIAEPPVAVVPPLPPGRSVAPPALVQPVEPGLGGEMPLATVRSATPAPAVATVPLEAAPAIPASELPAAGPTEPPSVKPAVVAPSELVRSTPVGDARIATPAATVAAQPQEVVAPVKAPAEPVIEPSTTAAAPASLAAQGQAMDGKVLRAVLQPPPIPQIQTIGVIGMPKPRPVLQPKTSAVVPPAQLLLPLEPVERSEKPREANLPEVEKPGASPYLGPRPIESRDIVDTVPASPPKSGVTRLIRVVDPCTGDFRYVRSRVTRPAGFIMKTAMRAQQPCKDRKVPMRAAMAKPKKISHAGTSKRMCFAGGELKPCE